MIAGAIEIQMLADLARLKKDMDDAKGVVSSAVGSIQNTLKSLGTALAATFGAVTLGGVATMVKDVLEAQEALHDLSIQTGATVESLSAFQSIGKTTGTSVDQIAGAMNKLSKNLAVANEDSKGAAAAIKALGINFETFRAMKPDQQMVTLAQAMNKFEDGGGKSAAAMTLMGREGAKLLPFMKDLAEQGELVAKVTSEQAAASDKFNDAMTQSSMRTAALVRGMVNELLPTLIGVQDLLGKFGTAIGGYVAGETRKATGEFESMRSVIAVIGTVLEALVVLASDVAFVFKGIGTEIGGLAAQAAAFVSGDFKAAAEIHRMMQADAQKSREELDKFQASILGMTDRALQSRDALTKVSVSAADNAREMANMAAKAGEAGKAQLKFATDTDVGKTAVDEATKALQKAADAGEKLANKLLSIGSGFSDSYEKDLENLSAAFNTGRLSADELTEAVKRLDAEQPAAKAMLALVTEQAQAVQKIRADESAGIDAWIAGQSKIRTDLAAQAGADATRIQTEIDNYGRLRSEIAATELARLEDARTRLAEGSKTAAEVDEQIKQQKRLVEALKNQEWEAAWRPMAEGLTDALMSGGDAVVDYLKRVFAQTVLRPVVQMVVNPVAQQLTAVLSGFSSGTLAGPPGGNAFGSGSLLGSAASLWSMFGAGASALGTGAAYGLSGTLAGTSLSSLLSASGSMIGAGSTMAGVGTALGSLGPYGALAAAAYMAYKKWVKPSNAPFAVKADPLLFSLYKLTGQDNYNTPHQGSLAVADELGSVLGGPNAGGLAFAYGGGDARFGAGVQGTAGLAASILNRLGGGGFKVATGYADDSSKDPAFGALNISRDGSTVFDWEATRNGSKWAPRVFSAGSEAGWKEYLADVATATREVIGSIGLPEWAQEVVDALDKTATLEDVAAVADYIDETISALNMLQDSLSPLGGIFATIAASSDDAQLQLADMVGGIDALIGKAASFVQSYYTTDEQAAIRAAGILTAGRDAGMSSGVLEALAGIGTKSEFRGLLEGVDVNAAGGLDIVAFGLNVAGEFAPLSDYLEKNGLTLGELAAQAIVPAILTGFSASVGAVAAASAADAVALDPVAGVVAAAATTSDATLTAPAVADAGSVLTDLLAKLTDVHAELVGARAERLAADAGLVDPIVAVRTLADRWDRDGLLIRGESDQPVYTTAAP